MNPDELSALRWLYTAFINQRSGVPDRGIEDIVDTLTREAVKRPGAAELFRQVSQWARSHKTPDIEVAAIQKLVRDHVQAELADLYPACTDFDLTVMTTIWIQPVTTGEVEQELFFWLTRDGTLPNHGYECEDDVNRMVELCLDALRDDNRILSDGSFWYPVPKENT